MATVDVQKFMAENGTVLATFSATKIGQIVMPKIFEMSPQLSDPDSDIDVRETLLNEFNAAAQQINDPNATFEALHTLTGIKLESLTGNPEADAQMQELGTFLGNLDADPNFRAALHGFATSQGLQTLNFDELLAAGDDATAEDVAGYKTALTHLSATEYGREAFTKSLTTLAADTDGITSEDFEESFRAGLTESLASRIEGKEGAELLETLKTTDGLIGNADVQADFFAKLEGQPEVQAAFLDAVKANPGALTTLAFEGAQDPTKAGTLASIIAEPMPEEFITESLAENGITMGGAELASLMTSIKAGIVTDVLGNPDLDLAEARDYIANFTDPDTGDIDFSSMAVAALDEDSDAPEVVSTIFDSATRTARNEVMKDPANWAGLLEGLGDNWDEIFDNLYDKIGESDLPPQIKQALQGLITVLQEGLPAMLDGLKMVGWDLPMALVGEIDRANRPGRDRRRLQREYDSAAEGRDPDPRSPDPETTDARRPGEPLVDPGIARALELQQ